MIPIKFFNQREKERIIRTLSQQFGIKELPFSIVRLGKERIMAFSGNMHEREILNLDQIAHIEGVGLYFAKEEMDGIRLSIEGSQLMKEQITKNIFNLDEKQAEQWMMGQEINLSSSDSEKKGFYIMKFKDDFLGTGKISNNRITNFVPKPRRLKFKEDKIKNEGNKIEE
jgi:NOL1/NOP2/fmu family ribosome biogenesis protein